MRVFSFCLYCAILLSGCADVHPLPEDFSRKTTFEIVQAIRCEAKRAIEKIEAKYDVGAIGYEFAFDITEDNSASIATTLTGNHLTNVLGTFAGIGGAGGTLKRQAVRSFTLVDRFGALRKLSCSSRATDGRLLYPITGNIGLTEVISTFTGAFAIKDKENKVPAPADGNTLDFSDDLTFTTSLSSGALTPTLTLNPVPNAFKLTSLSGSIGADRVDKHQVTVAIAMPAILRSAELKASAKRQMGIAKYGYIASAAAKLNLAVEASSEASVLAILDRKKAEKILLTAGTVRGQ
jgi:hypothetical protein